NTEIQVDKGDGTTEGILDNRLGSNAVYLNVFNDSIIGQALKYTGIAAVQTSMCSYLTTSTFEGNSISLSAEVSALIPVYKDYVQVQSYDYSNLTKADITELLSLADDLQNRILSSNLVESVYNELMPYLAKNILTNDHYFIRIPSLGDESRDAIVKNVLKNFAGLNDSYEYDSSKLVSLADIKHDISKGISMAGKVNGANLLLAFMNNQLTLEVVQENISVELGEQVLDDLLAMKTLQRLMPDVVEPAVEEVIKMIPTTKDRDNNDVSVEYVALDDGLDYDNFKQYLRRFVRNAILVVKDIEMESPLYIQGKNFANLGIVIDGLKTDEIVSEATFNSVVNYLMAVADKRVSEMTLGTEFDNIATAIVQTLDEIESFQTELGHFGDAYQKYLDSENGVTAQLVFEMLDDVKSTTLYTENIDTIIANGTTYLTTMITENDLPLATDNLGTILNKIKQVTSFADEYDKIESLYAYIDEKLIQGSVDDLLKEEVLVGLGEKLDDTIDAGSKLIDDENCKILIKNVIEKIELPTDLADKKAQIKTNVELIESYETELTAVAKALKISDISSDTTLTDRQKIVRLGAIIDEVKTSKLFGNVAVAVVKDYANAEIDKNTTLSANIVTTVKNAVNAITVGLTFENEFGYMYDLVNGADFDSISNFKTYLSDNLMNTDGSSKSGIIT
ncbi:MAG: hypothetical protein J6T39_03285, partial [Clostridia bacterium]|nr:hypothetical protein [Clostridia bacterium]